MSEECDIVKGENRLIKLPEAVLHHILSFLPIQDVVRTSVLSRHWEYLWTSIPNLLFDGKHCRGDSTTFLDFVDRSLFLRNFDISKFSLTIDTISDHARIRKWISALVWRNVQELSIQLNNCDNTLDFPHCLFTCASLRELELTLSNFCTLKLPTSTRLSNLEHLHLDSITFPDDHSTQMLFTGCPVLKTLTLFCCNWENINSLNICCPKLWWLSITDMDVIEEMWNESYGCQISILGSSLVLFIYSGALLNDYRLYDSSLLHQLCLNVYYSSQRSNIIADRLCKLMNGGYRVKKLDLSQPCPEVLTMICSRTFACIPLFKNLLCLELDLVMVDLHHESLVKILENCPRLKALEFTEGIEVSSYCERVKELFEPAPSCFLSRLRTIFVGNFVGNKQQCMDVVEVLLRRVKALKNLVFHYNPTSSLSSEEGDDNFIEGILHLPRAAEVLEMVYKNNCVKCGSVCHLHGHKKNLRGCWPHA